MGILAIILVVSTVVVTSSVQGMRMGPVMPPFVKGTGPRSIKDKLRIQPPPVPEFNLNAVSLFMNYLQQKLL